MPPHDLTIKIGSPVRIIKGANAGKYGRVTRLTPQTVMVDGNIRAYRTSVELIVSNDDNETFVSTLSWRSVSSEPPQQPQQQRGETAAAAPRQPIQSEPVDANTSLGVLKSIIDREQLLSVKKNVGGAARRTKADIVRDIHAARSAKDPSYVPAEESINAKTAAQPQSRQQRKTSPVDCVPPSFQVPGGATCAGLHMFGNYRVESTTLVPDAARPPGTFLDALFSPARIRRLSIPVAGKSLDAILAALPSKPQASTFTDAAGYKHELVMVTLADDGATFFGGTKKKLELVYIITEGPQLPAIDLERELGRVADFRALDPRKAVSRLQLALSAHTPAYKCVGPVTTLPASAFEMTDELVSAVTTGPMAEGLGYIPDALLVQILGALPATVSRMLGIQVGT